MNYKTHKVGGICFSLIATMGIFPIIIGRLKENDLYSILTLTCAMGGGFLGGLLPDLDQPSSKASRSLGIITRILSVFINAFFGHRGFTHTIWFALLLPILLIIPSPFLDYKIRTMYISFVYGVFWGIVSHIILDGLTKDRVKLFAPLSERKFGIPIFKTSKGEEIVRTMIIVITVVLVGMITG